MKDTPKLVFLLNFIQLYPRICYQRTFFKADFLIGDEDRPESEDDTDSVLFLFLRRNSF